MALTPNQSGQAYLDALNNGRLGEYYGHEEDYFNQYLGGGSDVGGISTDDMADAQYWSMSQYLNDNPDAQWLDVWTEAAKHSDEWAEKLMDYYSEKDSLDAANKYTAEREDSAYQRLVEDLKKAGLNPAMMFSGSASPSASASQGYIRQSEGANSRGIGNYSKLKSLMLNYMMYELKKGLGTANTVSKFLNNILGFGWLFGS